MRPCRRRNWRCCVATEPSWLCQRLFFWAKAGSRAQFGRPGVQPVLWFRQNRSQSLCGTSQLSAAACRDMQLWQESKAGLQSSLAHSLLDFLVQSIIKATVHEILYEYDEDAAIPARFASELLVGAVAAASRCALLRSSVEASARSNTLPVPCGVGSSAIAMCCHHPV